MANMTAAYSSGVLTVGVSNPPLTGAPTAATVSLLGQQITVPLTNNTGTVDISIHPSVANWNITATVNAVGTFIPPIPGTVVQLGSNAGPVGPLQLVAPGSGGSTWNIYPTQKAVLRAYYNGLSNPATALNTETLALQSLYVTDSLLLAFLIQHLIPMLQQATWSPLTLTPDEANAFADMQTNVLPYLPFALGNIKPASTNTDVLPYAEMAGALVAYQQAVDGYVAACAEIPNLQ